MRLIDADALREDLRRFFPSEVLEGIEPKTLFAQIMHDIDNAPTVIPDNDVFEWCTDCKEYDQEKHCCHRWSSKIREVAEEVKQYKLDELRPKGEWIDTGDMAEYWAKEYQCSICGEKDHWNNYCPHCGADMRGKEE